MRVAIIGGGIYGASLAYFLSRNDSCDVVLFEKGDIAGETTGKSAGIVRHHYSHSVHIKFAKRGSEILRNLEQHVGHDGGFHGNGFVSMAGPDRAKQFRKNVELEQAAGIDVEFIDPADASDYIPGTDPEGAVVAAFERDGGFADPYLVTTGFAQAATRLGTDIRTNTEVYDIGMDGTSVDTVTTSQGTEPFDIVVNAAGPGARAIAEMVDIDIPLQCYETKVVSLTSEKPYDIATPTLDDVSLDFWLKPEPGGEILAAGLDPEWSEAEIQPGDKPSAVSSEEFLRLQEKIETRAPGYSDVRIVNSWTGVITAPPDWHQVVGQPDSVDDFYFLAGASGHGFKEAPGFAEMLAHEILDEDHQLNLEPYRPDRFQDDDLFTGGYGTGSYA